MNFTVFINYEAILIALEENQSFPKSDLYFFSIILVDIPQFWKQIVDGNLELVFLLM